MALHAGETFAGYTIVRQIGSGGMGEVYLAAHPRLPRQEALKILRPDISTDHDFRRRFIREADSIAALEHPNIVTVHDRGETDNQLWISTQYVDGTDAARLLQSRYPAGMPSDEVADITAAIASALDYAHKKGLLHRDVKPANILLSHPDPDGYRRTYLADFGIARPLDDPAGLTATNFTLGTLAYAAPEQLMGNTIDGRADQYALAATAYHLLTGRPPYSDTNPVAVISHHLTEPPPPPSTVRAELAPFNTAFARALAKQPQDRFPRCQDFAHALTTATTTAARHQPEPRPRPDLNPSGSGSYSASAPTQQAQAAAEPTAHPRSKRLTPSKTALAGAVVIGLLAAAVAWWRPWVSQQDPNPSATNPSTPAITGPAIPGPPTSPTTSAPPPSVTTSPRPTPATPTPPVLQGVDGEFIAAMRGYGVPVSEQDPQWTVDQARTICRAAEDNPRRYPPGKDTMLAFVKYIKENNPDWTQQQATRLAHGGVDYYCPWVWGPNPQEIAAMPPDQRYLAMLLDRLGITPTDNGVSLINAARQWCGWKAQGWQNYQVVDATTLGTNNRKDLPEMVEIAIDVYCPEFSGR